MTCGPYLLAVLAFAQDLANDLLVVPTSVHIGRVPDGAALSSARPRGVSNVVWSRRLILAQRTSSIALRRVSLLCSSFFSPYAKLIPDSRVNYVSRGGEGPPQPGENSDGPIAPKPGRGSSVPSASRVVLGMVGGRSKRLRWLSAGGEARCMHRPKWRRRVRNARDGNS